MLFLSYFSRHEKHFSQCNYFPHRPLILMVFWIMRCLWIELKVAGVGNVVCSVTVGTDSVVCKAFYFLKRGRHSSELKPHGALWTPFLSPFLSLSLSHTYTCTHTLLTTLKRAHTNQLVDKRPYTEDPSCTKTILDRITASQFPDVENKLMITAGEREKEMDKLGTCD